MTTGLSTQNSGLLVSVLLIILGVLLGAGALVTSGGGATYILGIVAGTVLIVSGVVLIAVSIAKSRMEASE